MEERRHNQLSEADIERIATAVAEKTKEAFHIEEEKHYNDHQRLDAMLAAYEGARNIFWKTFLGMVIVGAIIMAGIVGVKGLK